jgi:hypothetical protein
MEEVWQYLYDDYSENHIATCEEQDSSDDLMAISIQALRGTEGPQTIKFRGYMEGKDVYMLLDSRSSHCFVSEQIAVGLPGWKALEQIAKVRVANGNEILYSHEIPDMLWSLQGHTF